MGRHFHSVDTKKTLDPSVRIEGQCIGHRMGELDGFDANSYPLTVDLVIREQTAIQTIDADFHRVISSSKPGQTGG